MPCRPPEFRIFLFPDIQDKERSLFQINTAPSFLGVVNTDRILYPPSASEDSINGFYCEKSFIQVFIQSA